MPITAQSLGNSHFKQDYNIKYAYLTGSMYKGIGSANLVIQLGKNGLMGFFGTGGLQVEDVEKNLQIIRNNLTHCQSFGMNLLSTPMRPNLERQLVDLYLKYQVKYIEAAAYTQIMPSLVYYRIKNLFTNERNEIEIPHHILAKISHPALAKAFMSPPPRKIVEALLAKGDITEQEAHLSQFIPMAHDICVEADSGGHTDQRVTLTLLPTILRLRDTAMEEYRYKKSIRVGCAGGIGTPEAAACVFFLGGDFILTGSINQSSVEANTSPLAKEILQNLDINDTTYVPAGDMLEIGSKVQVVAKGLLFPSRSKELYALYRQHHCIDEIAQATQLRIQNKYFHRSFTEVWQETQNYYSKTNPAELLQAEKHPKYKMGLIFKWYYSHCNKLAIRGVAEQRVNFQIQCGSAMGAFNQWVKNTSMEHWQNRHVVTIAEELMNQAAYFLKNRNLF
jgi:trans-AT polyketide synthase/acyltransferase/oxidoreductase domain-containing protein